MPSEPIDFFADRVERTFQEAVDLEGEARARFLAEACGGDAALRDAVRELLDASSRAEQNTIWNEPAILLEAKSTASHEDTTPFERYRLIERVGTGGMGVVYKAVRADDAFSKLVAVKIVHHGADDEGAVRRFRQERQILAGLEHPNIGRLLDGGSTGDGRPFLVMEYVDGVPIDRYVSEKRLPLREMLDLFRKICGAVAYAHHNLVVHRDLKPANILVDAAGEPKLLDFGIAKLLDGSAERTKTGANAMTPEYASPEQIRGAPITTASDVYSLGVLLYELLTGVRPYRDTGNAIELAQAITGGAPELMSVKTGRRFDRDIENIVQMALRKEPERRYASVEQFSDDIRRYQQGFPVSARPDTRTYRAIKFVARHKAALASSTAAAILLAALALGMFIQWREARRRFAEVRAISNSLIFDVYDSVRDLPGSLAARKHVVGIAREYLDRLAADRNPDDALRLELATAYRKLGDIEGEPYTSSLGDSAGALENYRKAERLLEGAKHPNREELATVYQQIGRVLVRQGHALEGRQMQLKAVPVFEQLWKSHPNDIPSGLRMVSAYIFLGQAAYILASNHSDRASADLALRDYLSASEAAQAILRQAPRNPLALGRYGLAEYHVCAAYWTLCGLTGDRGYYRRAAESSARAVEFEERASAINPNISRSLNRLADAYMEHARALELANNGKEQAVPLLQKAYAIFLGLAGAERDNKELVRSLANIEGRLAQSTAGSNWRKAQEYYSSAMARFDNLSHDDPGNMEIVGEIVALRNGMASIFFERGKRAEAVALHRQNLELLQRVHYPGDLEAKEQMMLKDTLVE